MKKISLKSRTKEDLVYTSFSIVSIRVNGEKIGEIVTTTPMELSQVIEKIYKEGFDDGKKLDPEMEMIGNICVGATKCVKSYKKILAEKAKKGGLGGK